MPWNQSDVERHKKGLSDAQKRRWVGAANGAREQCIEDGGDPDECDARAIRIANAAVEESAEMNENIAAKTMVEVGEKEVSLLDLIEDYKKGVAEAYSSDIETGIRYVPPGIVSFADLKAHQAAEEKAQDIKQTTGDFQAMVSNIMWDSEIVNKTAALRSLMDEFADQLDADMAERLGELTKTVSGKSHPMGDFLVVEDPEKVTTWHLPVKNNGAPDHRLMGAAKAALTGGYRGQRYEGPDKQAAITKLKALYKSEDMVWEADMDDATIISVLDHLHSRYLAEQTYECECLECGHMMEVEEHCRDAKCEECGGEMRRAERPGVGEELAESLTGLEVLSEGTPDNGRGPLTLKAKLIEPGFGNPKDKHYYPREMLERDARVFVGAKMHESQHGQDKTTRTWVSTVTDIVGFSETGAPLAEVVVHDPDFAQRVRNLGEKNLLDRMECSILASGTVRAGKVDGEEARIVEAITKAENVDWVTRAGAGGKALELMEADMTDEKTDEEKAVEEPLAETTPTEEEETKMEKEDVRRVLDAANVPQAVVERLSETEFADEDEVRTAAAAEMAYLVKATGSGRVTGNGPADEPQRMTRDEYVAEMDAVDAKYGLRR